MILTDTKNAQGNIPGKLFEYLATGVPVLALGDPEGDSARILKEAEAGQVIRHGDQMGIQAQLRAHVSIEKSTVKLESLSKFSRKNLTHQLARILDEHTLS